MRAVMYQMSHVERERENKKDTQLVLSLYNAHTNIHKKNTYIKHLESLNHPSIIQNKTLKIQNKI